ncbi:transcription and mRNA export factor ENY2-like [Corticium candelabrum]|uniref:transcription and mRNA export factor ENY2-like n=1 Tax=Corticium candelabrum TaxID=121492 RepID=UPI002E2676F2|nr:transcription and mRNA export factor ENY2-like [Corticium candelabrum]
MRQQSRRIMADVRSELRLKESQIKQQINQKLTESGEKERLQEYLRMRLIESGWKDKLKDHCKEVVKQKGLDRITVEDLIAEITPRARATVPDEVKRDLLQKIRDFLAKN